VDFIRNEIFEEQNVIVTGGAGFIGSALIRNLLLKTSAKIINFDKISYASDLDSINHLIDNRKNKIDASRYKLLKIDLAKKKDVDEALFSLNPSLVIHLAAESHVDKSIEGPEIFIQSNIIGTFNILEASRCYYKTLKNFKKNLFRFHHVSTDEVYGSAEKGIFFNENSIYDPRSPYSASKASSDHLVSSWFNTYNLPITISNCSNNFGPWQFPEKLIPLAITNALQNKKIPLYGNGQNIRDWLYVDDHINAILKIILFGKIGEKYCIGAKNERSNSDILFEICTILDKLRPTSKSYKNLITKVKDRAGHDKRYAIDPTKIENELGWEPNTSFSDALFDTVNWYLINQKWWRKKIKKDPF